MKPFDEKLEIISHGPELWANIVNIRKADVSLAVHEERGLEIKEPIVLQKVERFIDTHPLETPQINPEPAGQQADAISQARREVEKWAA